MTDQGGGISITLNDVYHAVQTLGEKVSQETSAAEFWRHNHEVTDLQAFASINTRLSNIESKLIAVDVALATQDKNVTTALAAVDAARDKAELAVDKRFEKVDQIGAAQDQYESAGKGRLAGSQATQTLVFALIGAMGIVAGLIFAILR